jgi:hypothetical protein
VQPVETGMAVPEAFYLLGVVYNEAMHLYANEDNVRSVFSNFKNTAPHSRLCVMR